MGHILAKEFKSKSGKTFRIRTAESSDAANILTHARAVMEEQYYTLTQPHELPFTEKQEADWIQGMVENPSSLIIVALVENEVVGMLDFSPGHRQRIAHTGEFGMSVSKAHRENGIGNALLTCLVDWATQHPIIEKICLKVHATNPRAIGLYRKHWFIEEGRQSKDLKYGPNEYVDSILMGRFVR